MTSLRPPRAAFLAATLWAVLCVAGFGSLWAHNGRPGPAAAAPFRWPGAGLAREDGRSALLMFVHPHCPCTAAALGELDWLLARLRGRPSVNLILVRPPGVPAGWEETDSWRKARNLPGVKVLRDEDGELAARFGARVSGQVLVYDAGGRLAFGGGITYERGHRGGNPGRDAALAALNGAPGRGAWPVFGCALTESVL